MPIVAVALVAASAVVTESDVRAGRRLDLAGAGLAALALVAVTLRLHRGRAWWPAAPVVIAAVCAAAGAAAFVAVERRARDPLLPLGLLRRPTFVTANGVAGAMNLASLGLLFVVTLYLQEVRHGRADRRRRPAAAVRAAGRPGPAGRPRRRAHRHARPILGGLLVAAAGVALLAAASRGTGAAALPAPLLLWGCGLGVLTRGVVSAAMGAVERERAGLASAVNNTARQAGGAVGIAGFGALAAQRGVLAGLHAGALVAAALYVVAAVVAGRGLRPPRRTRTRG